MKRILAIIGILLSVLLALAYGSDYLVLRYRVARSHDPFGTVTVYRYYAVEKKNNKVEYIFLDSQAETCVHSLFPHLGDLPCWYLTGHTERKIEV